MKLQKFYFIDLPSWLIILMPITLITGPFLPDLSLSLICILFLINSFKNNLTKFYDNIYFKSFAIFYLVLVTSSLLSDNILNSLKTSFFYFRFGIFSLSFWFLIENNSKILKFLFYSILICFIALIIDGYLQYFLGENLFGTKLYNKYRVSSFFGDELILGSYLSRFFPILFGLFVFFDQKKKNKKLLFLISIVFILVDGLIFLSGERLALFFMNLSAIFIILMINNYKIYRLWTYALSLILIATLLFLFPQSKIRFLDQTIYDMTRTCSEYIKNEQKKNHGYIASKCINGKKQFYIFSKPHNDLYSSGIAIFLDNKFFGVGPRQFRNKCKEYPVLGWNYITNKNDAVSEYSCSSHPHNTYIELLSETGVFGFLFVISLLVIVLYYSIKHFIYKFIKNKIFFFNDFEICLISALIISIWPLSPSGSFFNNWMSIIYFFPIGMLLWQINLKKNF
tara:strand:- start:854 stop:2212 length:1359 start_codon:yes stop_codon:yes gene_type:complete